MVIIGSLIDELHALREKKRELEAQLKEIEGNMSDVERMLIGQMDIQQITASAGTVGSVSISELVKPTVENWDDFIGFIKRNDAFYLLERRPSVTGWRELYERGQVVDGVVPFKQRRIRLITKEQK